MKQHRRPKIVAYIDGKIWTHIDGKKVDVIQVALDNNMMVDDLKKKLITENPGHEITFKIKR